MGYSIGQAAKKKGLTAHTLRYYDKEGLLPFVKKASSGQRVFAETDLEWLDMIECLKGTGMPLKDIKQYLDWFIAGDSTLPERLEMFKKQKVKLDAQISQLKKHMEKIEYKIALYTEAVKVGSMDQVLEHNPQLQKLKNRIYGRMGDEQK